MSNTGETQTGSANNDGSPNFIGTIRQINALTNRAAQLLSVASMKSEAYVSMAAEATLAGEFLKGHYLRTLFNALLEAERNIKGERDYALSQIRRAWGLLHDDDFVRSTRMGGEQELLD